MKKRLALIGFGEAGQTFTNAASWGQRATAFDTNPSRCSAIAGGDGARDAASALKGAEVVLSLVTADQALPAARDYALFLQAGTIWCDMNSVAPSTKREAALAVEAAGGRYVDVAILAPVNPAGLGVPLLLSGPCASEAAATLIEAGFTNVRTVGLEIGKASAIKMIRSVMVKGVEALTDEMMAAANAAGVVEDVLVSLDRSEKTACWADKATYNLERMTTHGSRRAAEMQEVAKTLNALGVEPLMTNATVVRQRDAATCNRQSKDAT